MTEKMLCLDSSIYKITTDYPEVIEIMNELGFHSITRPALRRTVGRKMTLPAGCRLQKIPLEDVVAKLEEAGFVVKGGEQSE